MVLFMHVHKCAGSTVKRMLFHSDVWEGEARTLVGPFHRRHDNVHPIERHEMTGEQFQSAFKFAFVRNPWDRMVSAWQYFVQSRGWKGSLAEFVAIAINDKIPYDRMATLQSGLASDVHIRHHTRPDYMLSDMNFIGTYESFESDLKIVLERIGYPKPWEIPVINYSSHGNYKAYYDDATWRIVKNYYQEDIERFDYESLS